MQLPLMDLIDIAHSKPKTDFIEKKYLDVDKFIQSIENDYNKEDLDDMRDEIENGFGIINFGMREYDELSINPVCLLLKNHNISFQYESVESYIMSSSNFDGNDTGLEQVPDICDAVFETPNSYYRAIIQRIMQNNGVHATEVNNAVICDDMYEEQSFSFFFLTIFGGKNLSPIIKNYADTITSDGDYIYVALIDESTGCYHEYTQEETLLVQTVLELVKDDECVIKTGKAFQSPETSNYTGYFFRYFIKNFSKTKEVIF